MSTAREDNDVTIQEEFVKVQGVKTCVLKLGEIRGVAENTQRVLMLIIPGNPGLPHFYEDFMQELYSHCDNQIPVWAVGHAGHVQPPDCSLSASDVYSTPENLYGLDAQISHKVAFIQENVPSDVLLILIGHSIGCYMILNMLDQLPSKQVLHGFMLFPTIERMAVSPSGLKMTPILRYFRWLMVLATFTICLIPRVWRKEMIKWWYRKVDYPVCMQGAVLETVTPWTTNFTTFLAKLEMNRVKDLQKDLIEKHSNKLSFYYGADDHWAPVQYYHDIVKQYPDLDARLCSLNLKHAFVLDTQEGKEMAKIVWLWAQSHHQTVLSQACKNGEEAWVFSS